jgi:DNA-directed RNA polymerase subunit RPC12/RpoP
MQEMISFQCTGCSHQMRIGADKAGRKAKCPRCGTSMVIPAANPSGIATAAPPPLASPPPPPPLPPADDDDEGGAYQLKVDIEEEKKDAEAGAPRKRGRATSKNMWDEDEEGKKKRDADDDEDKGKARLEAARIRKQRVLAVASMRKAPMDTEKWDKVRIGILIVAIGMCIWALATILQKGVLLAGLAGPREYAYLAATELVEPGLKPAAHEAPPLHRAAFVVGLLGGSEYLDACKWLLIISYILFMLQVVVTGTGYGFCLVVPDRFGTRALAITALSVAAVNLLITLFFRLLPVTETYDYVLIQLIAPEVSMLSVSIGRLDPIQVTWSIEPFSESFWALICHLVQFAEPILFCIFLRGVALTLKDDILEKKTHTLIRLGMGVAFIYTSFFLLTNAGTSEVLINLLRAVYLLFMGFYIWYLTWCIMVLFASRERIVKKLKYF